MTLLVLMYSSQTWVLSKVASSSPHSGEKSSEEFFGPFRKMEESVVFTTKKSMSNIATVRGKTDPARKVYRVVSMIRKQAMADRALD